MQGLSPSSRKGAKYPLASSIAMPMPTRQHIFMRIHGCIIDHISSGHWIGNSILFLCSLHTSTLINMGCPVDALKPASWVVPRGRPIGIFSSISTLAVGCLVDAVKPASLVVPRGRPVLLSTCLPCS